VLTIFFSYTFTIHGNFHVLLCVIKACGWFVDLNASMDGSFVFVSSTSHVLYQGRELVQCQVEIILSHRNGLDYVEIFEIFLKRHFFGTD